MTNFMYLLKQEVEVQLHVLEKEEVLLSKAQRAILLLKNVFERLREFTGSYVFKDEAEEICFFKEDKPWLLSNLIYYQEMYNMEMNRPTGGDNELRKFFTGELSYIKGFFDRNKELYRYYRAKDTYMDKCYFLRGKPGISPDWDDVYFERDPRFSSPCDFKVARILANDKIEVYLTEQLDKLDHKIPVSDRSDMLWTASKADLTELIYSNYLLQSINGGKITLKEMQRKAESIFNIDLGNLSRTLYDLGMRNNPTQFLDKLRKALGDYLNNNLNK